MIKKTNILIVDVANGEYHPILPEGNTGNLDATWSPDGKQIAFVSYRSGKPELWIVNVDGTNLRQLTSSGQYIRFPIWRKPQDISQLDRKSRRPLFKPVRSCLKKTDHCTFVPA